MTAADLIHNPTFLAFCARWQADGRAPLVGADWLEELGLVGQARAWAWAAETRRNRGDAKFSGPSPWRSTKPEWVWFLYEESTPFYNDLPREMGRGSSRYACSEFPAAIAWFIDRWADVFGESPVPLTRTEAVV